jgi:hypothetical protein
VLPARPAAAPPEPEEDDAAAADGPPPPYMLHPHSRRKLAWDWLVIALVRALARSTTLTKRQHHSCCAPSVPAMTPRRAPPLLLRVLRAAAGDLQRSDGAVEHRLPAARQLRRAGRGAGRLRAGQPEGVARRSASC